MINSDLLPKNPLDSILWLVFWTFTKKKLQRPVITSHISPNENVLIASARWQWLLQSMKCKKQAMNEIIFALSGEEKKQSHLAYDCLKTIWKSGASHRPRKKANCYLVEMRAVGLFIIKVRASLDVSSSQKLFFGSITWPTTDMPSGMKLNLRLEKKFVSRQGCLSFEFQTMQLCYRFMISSK